MLCSCKEGVFELLPRVMRLGAGAPPDAKNAAADSDDGGDQKKAAEPSPPEQRRSSAAAAAAVSAALLRAARVLQRLAEECLLMGAAMQQVRFLTRGQRCTCH